MKMFELKFKDYLEKNPDVSMVSLAWSFWWRITILVYGILFAIGFLAEVING